MTVFSLPLALTYLRDAIGDIDAPGISLEAFPTSEIDKLDVEASYENLDAAVRGVKRWLDGLSADAFKDFPAFMFHDFDEAVGVILSYHPVWRTIMPEYLLEDGGTVRAIPNMMPTPEGARRLHGLGNAVLYHGVQASVFNHALKAVKVYDGREALEAGSVAGLTPVGTRAEYRIAILDGEVMIPPAWPADVIKRVEAPAVDEMEPGL